MNHVHARDFLRPKSLKMPFYNLDRFPKAGGENYFELPHVPTFSSTTFPFSPLSCACSMQTPTDPSSLPRLDGHLQELHQTEQLCRCVPSNRATWLERPGLHWLGRRKHQGMAKRGEREGHAALSCADASGAGVRGHCASSLISCCKTEVNRVMKRDPATTNWEFHAKNNCSERK
jgi:hypothetical protein